ncbi:GntR family transcriptional regulator [Rhizobiaceae bacterium BDR2-2]|uniref:GntR family transcriptional regulator n=1 Tax=Ectorhizobium quercum TaxID=2965071 RepID=A0AAE3N2D9_9HYPH|nr:GntR family transcriptional regulator [Ectorhizobium quercum]MCX8998025.1 GntR family transcriptional regulator [Ectorhizobium quercum]
MHFEFRPMEAGDGQPKAVKAYNELRDAIITMKLPPGAALHEREICAQLGISRTPMREAVLRLAQEGLVNVIPSGGTFVNKISVRDVIEGQIVRDALEMRMVRLAARNFQPDRQRDFDLLMFRQQEAAKRADADDAFAIDNEFHRLICTVAGFPNIWQTIHASTGQLDRLRRRAYPKEGFFDEVVEEHAAIQKAIAAHDEAEAVRLMKVHIDGIAAVLRFVMASYPDIMSDEDDTAILDMLLAPGE